MDYIDDAARRSTRYSEGNYVSLGWLSWLIPAAVIVDYVVGNPSFDTFLIRLSAAFVGIPAIFYRNLSPSLLKYFHIYFVIGAAYCFPFTYGLMLSMNAATTPPDSQLHMIWIIQYIIALFLFIQIVVDNALASVLWVLSCVLVLLPIPLLPVINTDELVRVLVYPITGYLTALGIGLVTNRKSAIVDSEKASAAAAIGANLAHELRTPLASIGTTAKGVTNLLPVLTSAYDRAKEAGIQVEPLRRTQLEKLNEALESIGKEVEYSNTIIDMLLVNTTDKPLSDVDAERFSVESVIREAVRRYPFNNSRERNMITVRVEDDFDARAPRLLIVHVLFNLIKNGLYFVQKAGKGGIVISTRLSAEGNQIVVHDNGAGIPPGIRPHIFERFYTTTQAGQSAGIGLSFCRLVMDSVGGGISCESEVGEFATFYLTFPPVKD